MSSLFRLALAPGERRDIEAVVNDRFQSPRARKRCQALLLLMENVDSTAIHRRTGQTVGNQQHMIERLQKHGVQAAIFGSPQRPERQAYDKAAIADVVVKCLNSRPPPGSVYWTLVQLLAAVHNQLPSAASLSKETLRVIMKQELKIPSIRAVEPFWLRQVKCKA